MSSPPKDREPNPQPAGEPPAAHRQQTWDGSAKQGVPVLLGIGYGIGTLGTSTYSTTVAFLLMIFLTDTLNIPPWQASIAIFIPRIWDIITDPVMGYISDHTRTSIGRRRPYLLLGACVLGAAFTLLFWVPRFEMPVAAAIYVGVLYLAATTGYTIFSIPYTAMPAEMTDEPHAVTSIVSYRMAFMLLGVLFAGGLGPELVRSFGGGRVGFAGMSTVLGAIVFTSLVCAFFGTRRARFQLHIEHAFSIRDQFRIALGNHAFFILLASYVMQLTAVNATTTSLPYFVKYVLGRDEGTLTRIFLCFTVPAMLAMPLLVWLSRRIGKQAALFGCCLGFALAIGMLPLMGSKDGGTLLWIFLTMGLAGMAYGGTQLFPFSMLPDTIAGDFRASGMRREGVFTGIWVSGEKAGMAGGVVVAGAILQATGFQESSEFHTVEQTGRALTGIVWAFAYAPALLFLLSLPLVARYTIPGSNENKEAKS